ncbi:hypothetical protein ACFYU9_13170 [Streptomyces sp. NPDC004327]|uniref:hypothetical protein n=1 Tax=Streptomyces sp. NPDC004327 TaxID=3364699 RepID=UPI0036C25A4A
MERGTERGIGVENAEGVVVIGDGNRVAVGTGAAHPVRSGYREQVRRLAPDELVGRERELAELEAFCRPGAGAGSGPAYVWWRADAWAGKTALLAWFTLNPPPGVRLVSFFVTARMAAQNDTTAFTDVVLEQLAEIAGEPLPALLTAATREAHLLRLYGTAARACAARGERLVLLVDGLDEDRGVTTGADAHSIAGLLPADGLRVIVSGRLNPPLPPDVPDGHPLRDPAVVRLLAPSPAARAIRADAERELKHLLAGGGLPYELLALLTASGGGLTADDLAGLTGEVPYRVKDLLRTGPGRTFALRGDGYLLAHEELAVGAREMLGERELARWREALHAWAEEWRARGWPEGTPDYLLRGYVAMLRAAEDVDRLTGCALDAVRHDRMLAATGGDAAALDEVAAAGEELLARSSRPDALVVMLRLALRRSALKARNGVVPAQLPAAWAELGETDRALALARGLEPANRARALCAVAEVLRGAGDPGQAYAVLTEAGTAALGTREPERTFTLWTVGSAWLEAGDLDRTERVMHALPEGSRSRLLLDLIGAWAGAGDVERALGAARDEKDRRTRDEGFAVVCGALEAAGRGAEALDLARGAEGRARALALIRIGGARRGPGREPAADALVEEGLAHVAWEDLEKDTRFAGDLVTVLVADGAVEHAERLVAEARVRLERRDRRLPVDGLPLASMRVALLLGLVRAGEPDRAESLLGLLGAPHDRGRVMAELAEHWARQGAVERIEPLLDGVTDPFFRVRLVEALIGALVMAGREGDAEALAWRETAPADRRGLALKVRLVRALTAAGRGERAGELLGRVEAECREPRPEEAAPVLGAVAEELTLAGHREEAHRLTEGLTAGTDREPELLRVVRGLVAAGRHEEAAREAEGARSNQRDYLRKLVARCRDVRGAGQLAEEFDRPVADRGCVTVEVHEDVPRPLPAPLPSALPSDAETAAERARALHTEGREEEAAAALDHAVAAMRRVLRRTAAPLATVVRAQRELGTTAELAALLDEAETYVRLLTGQRELAHLARACVAGGFPDRAVSLMRDLGPADSRGDIADQLSLVRVLARAGEHARAERLLGSLAPLGSLCTPAYAHLAAEHPDAASGRELAAHALHLGPWYDALPGLLAHAPEAVPLVVAEAERLRRALQI